MCAYTFFFSLLVCKWLRAWLICIRWCTLQSVSFLILCITLKIELSALLTCCFQPCVLVLLKPQTKYAHHLKHICIHPVCSSTKTLIPTYMPSDEYTSMYLDFSLYHHLSSIIRCRQHYSRNLSLFLFLARSLVRSLALFVCAFISTKFWYR